MPEIYDAIVIGGGLAGSLSGIFLNNKGWRVLILEKSRYPRNKVCGEFLSPAAQGILKQAGLDGLVRSKRAHPIHSVSFFWPRQKPLTAKIPSQTNSPVPACGISRKALDEALLQEAENRGCEVLQDTEALNIEKQSSGRRLFDVRALKRPGAEKKYTGRWIIQASGRNVSESAGQNRNGHAFGFKAHFSNLPVGAKTELYFFDSGYLGLLEVEDGLSTVCGKIHKKKLAGIRGNFDLLFKRIGEQNPFFAERTAGGKRHTEWLSCGPLLETFHGGYRNGIFYAGDAACFVEPVLGQGMTLAMASAFLLSSVLPSAPDDRPDLNRLEKNYTMGLKKLYESKLYVGKLLRPFGFSLSLGKGLATVFARFPFFLDYILKANLRGQNKVQARRFP